MYKEALEQVIAAWEATKPGTTTSSEIQRWLIEDMKPAIDKARDALTQPVPSDYAGLASVPRYNSSGIMWSLDGVELVPDEKGEWIRYSEAIAALSGVGPVEVKLVDTGCKDRNGKPIHLGDMIRYNNEGPATKPEYWNPEYEVIFKAPSFTLRYIGGGKDGGSYDFILRSGGVNGYLEIIQSTTPPEQGDAAQPAADGWVMVPREPTEEMIDAAIQAHEPLDDDDDLYRAEFRRTYASMIAASAAPQEREGSSERHPTMEPYD